MRAGVITGTRIPERLRDNGFGLHVWRARRSMARVSEALQPLVLSIHEVRSLRCMYEHTRRTAMMMCFRRGFLSGGFLMLLCWATGVLVVAALTTWWVLLALVPLAMMVSVMETMETMTRSSRDELRTGLWGWCATWLSPTARKGGTR